MLQTLSPALAQAKADLQAALVRLIRSGGVGGLTAATDVREYENLVLDTLFQFSQAGGFTYGAGQPANSLGYDGQMYFDIQATSTAPASPADQTGGRGNIYLRENGAWTFLFNMRGFKGEPGKAGDPGQSIKGDPGPEGKSAYQLAQDAGFAGNEAQWRASLKGDPGQNAYQVALAEGFIGTRAQWLASLKGAASTVKGDSGKQGDPGDQGPAGPNAYQVAVTAGFSGTEGQWLASLKGADGAKILHLASDPAATDGKPGDTAINDVTGETFEKTAATTWTKRGTMKGPKGDPGTGTGTGTGTGGSYVFTDDIPVNLAGGKMAGKYPTGSIIKAKGLTPQVVFTDIFNEDILPSYTPAQLALTHATPQNGEVGEHITPHLVNTFTQNDAGPLVQLRLTQDGIATDLTSASSPLSVDYPVVRKLAGTTFQALADYQAGPLLDILPGHTPDTRPPAVRQPDAPQAAENGFASNLVVFLGWYRLYFGSVATTTPTNRAQAMALSGSGLLCDGNTFTLNTGSSNKQFCILLPPGKTLLSVTDLDNLNANLTSAYVAQELLDLADASGVLVAGYRPYVYQAAVPYANPARHQFTIS